jgi:hypothetical protein
MNVNKEEALREVFEETVPDHGVFIKPPIITI